MAIQQIQQIQQIQDEQDPNVLDGGYVKLAEPPPDGTFDIGLVSAGAVSGGAFSAGVMDFLIEALDAFEAAKSQARSEHGDDPQTWPVPGHDIRLRVLASASAGSIVGAISAVAFKYRFPPVRLDTAEPQHNPLYRTWVSEIDIKKLLDTRDFSDGNKQIVSVLDSTVLNDIAVQVMNYQGDPAPNRPWLHNPVRFIFTQNNLRGIPYSANMMGNTATPHRMLAHADYVSFSGRYDGQPGKPARADDGLLTFPNGFGEGQWQRLATAALGSGAFPVFLCSRVQERPIADYNYRFLLIPTEEPGQLGVAKLHPDWTGHETDPYSTVVVDGGTMNNEPLELARTELAGIAGRNPRAGDKADRAIILIDPFPGKSPDQEKKDEKLKGDLVSSALGLLGSWIDQSRFTTAEMALAEDDQVYSRFMIVPNRNQSNTSNFVDLASGSLGSFGGFLSEDFRRHDFLLGRRNCQQFLRRYFSIPVANAKLATRINPELLQEGKGLVFRDQAGQLQIPLIPLYGKLADEERSPDWPINAFDPDTLNDALAKRLDALESGIGEIKFFKEHPLRKAELWAGWKLAKRSVVEHLISTIRDDLVKHNLLPKT